VREPLARTIDYLPLKGAKLLEGHVSLKTAFIMRARNT
jgi:hypothetical protein